MTAGPHIRNLFYRIVFTKSINKNSSAIISCVHSLDTIFRRRFKFFAACAKIAPRIPVLVLPIQTKFSSTLCQISNFSLNSESSYTCTSKYMYFEVLHVATTCINRHARPIDSYEFLIFERPKLKQRGQILNFCGVSSTGTSLVPC